ncbi:hypothetical protein [Limnobacter sp.]|uniref:hypothetical protein n=1 Tax=Limnobacter sp. TaxID=2003368 RepID=UPI00351177CC
MLTAWQTVWVCTGLSLLVVLLDAWLANRAGPSKEDVARAGMRGKRTARFEQGERSE